MQKGADGQYGANSFQAQSTQKVKLSGAVPQAITFASPGYSRFNILEVTNHLADISIVSVANSGTLKFNYSGTNLIEALFLSGTAKPNGLYDSSNTGRLITGTGGIQVGPFANYSAWIDVNAPGQTTNEDHDHDGVPNGIEYFMGKTGNDFTANSGIAPDGTVTWPKSPTFNGSYAVQTSADLVVWADVTEDTTQVTRNSDSVVWTPPTGLGSRFVRLLVTPNS